MGVKGKSRDLLVIILCLVIFLCSIVFIFIKVIKTSKKSPESDSANIVKLLKDKNSVENKDIINNQENKKGDTKSDKGDTSEVTIKISAVGDCTLGEDRSVKGNTFSSVYNKQGAKYFFQGVVDILSKDDITIANLEGPLTENSGSTEKKFVFKGKPEYTKILTEGSIEAVNLANNHTYDYGEVGFQDTKKHLEEAGIEYFGDSKEDIIEINGIKIGLLGYKGWNGSIKSKVEEDIKNLKKSSDTVIVSFHWGDEKSSAPNKVQKTLGRAAVDAGADLILGHHPHVIQGIEKYNGKNIVYSLGNFSFGGNTNPNDKDSFIYVQSFTFGLKDPKDSKKSLLNISQEEKIPVSISSTKGKNDYKPKILEGSEKERVSKKIEERSKLIN